MKFDRKAVKKNDVHVFLTIKKKLRDTTIKKLFFREIIKVFFFLKKDISNFFF